METTLVKFVKDENNQPIGCVVAAKVDANDTVYITGSTCRIDKERFRKTVGLNIALRRVDTMALGKRLCPQHPRMDAALTKMETRAKRYFKDARGFVRSPVRG